MVRIDFFRALSKFYPKLHSLHFAHLLYHRYILNLRTDQLENVDLFNICVFVRSSVCVCVQNLCNQLGSSYMSPNTFMKPECVFVAVIPTARFDFYRAL